MSHSHPLQKRRHCWQRYFGVLQVSLYRHNKSFRFFRVVVSLLDKLVTKSGDGTYLVGVPRAHVHLVCSHRHLSTCGETLWHWFSRLHPLVSQRRSLEACGSPPPSSHVKASLFWCVNWIPMILVPLWQIFAVVVVAI